MIELLLLIEAEAFKNNISFKEMLQRLQDARELPSNEKRICAFIDEVVETRKELFNVPVIGGLEAEWQIACLKSLGEVYDYDHEVITINQLSELYEKHSISPLLSILSTTKFWALRKNKQEDLPSLNFTAAELIKSFKLLEYSLSSKQQMPPLQRWHRAVTFVKNHKLSPTHRS